jgi:hypothetical protein
MQYVTGKAAEREAATKGVKDGTVKYSSEIDFSGDLFKRSHETRPGFYVFFGMWKGPFESAYLATEAYREWAWELKHS